MGKRKNKNYGFTLIEVILVVAIITILSAIAVPQVGKYLNKANRSKVIGAVAELNNSSTSWSIDNGGDVPSNIQDIFTEHGNINKLGIGIDSSGNFKIGNITGKLEIDNGEVYAKIDSNSRAFPGEEIRR
ncbi:MAG: type II secretion system protein [Leptotrichiaceae bacterium]|nr:type II secretion system protein [Leptotrichiaceae bacterium]MBP6281390.1 type II secretion system protein [Leptotrichiaceae bacterium]MBP7101544.1 type II secretion system protein [Leptotrichiaceae bacterium]MBP7725163.1 type II secretion system protein [Leptotrichiaceae bacterium]MBP9629154.1 type II secretion system protein [Leptotrichiaceae bacterium]